MPTPPEPDATPTGAEDSDPETIAAIATPPGYGGIGILRVSGSAARGIAQAVAGRVPPPRTARYATFRDASGEPVDAGLVLFFPGPASFTGEDVVELQGHGGPVVMQLLRDAAIAAGARAARPGEFTERAFHNGKLDLAQAEAVADLIASASAEAARGARKSLAGEFSERVNEIDRLLVDLRVFVEAAIDFPDEEIDFLAESDIAGRIDGAKAKLEELRRDSALGVLLRDGIRLAIVGEPNVGKSSLLNRLAGESLAIVTDIPGTTRDLVRADLIIDGLAVEVVDTAGLRQSADAVEQEGVRRALEQAGQADVALWVAAATAVEGPAGSDPWRGSDRVGLEERLDPARTIRVLNKIDLVPDSDPGVDPEAGSGVVRVSASDGSGVDALRRAIRDLVGFAPQETRFTARKRHLDLLAATAASLAEAQALAKAEPISGELIAEELREAHVSLGDIVGQRSADDLLGEIFSSFCIGK